MTKSLTTCPSLKMARMNRRVYMQRDILFAAVLIVIIHSTESSDHFTDDEETCLEGLFQCQQKLSPHQSCISMSWVCDGEKDCPDGSDEEQNCDQLSCAPDKFQCADYHSCIPRGWLCDGDQDCSDGSDETPHQDCPDVDYRCPPDQYLCDGTRMCIKLSQLCDGIADCPDNIDEGSQCRSDICFTNAPCSDSSVCRLTSNGATLCDCGVGRVYDESTRTCQDMNECAYDGYCDQLCTNTNGSFTCRCQLGYRLENGAQCVAIDEPSEAIPRLLYSSASEIVLSSLDGSSSVRTVGVSDVKAMDYNYANTSFCYSAVMETGSCIYLYSVGVQQIAYDWLSNNWYFTDDRHERIFVCRGTDGQVCVTIISVNLKPPHSIAIDPLKDRIFFITLGESPRIEAASLIGQERSTLVQSKQIVRPQGLTLDYANEHVYWSDVYLDRIERIKYDGTGRKLIVRRLWVEGLHSIALHENFLYGASQQNDSIIRFHRQLDNSMVLRSAVTAPTTIRVVHQQRQPPPLHSYTNPCERSACSDICVVQPNVGTYSATCLCRAGYKLVNGNCTLFPTTKLLLYSNAKLGEIKGISLNESLTADVKSETADPVDEVIPPISGLERPVAIDVDAEKQYIYYSDALKRVIGRRSVNGGPVEEVINSGILNCEGIAVDTFGGNIYWTDEELKRISVARLDNTTIRKTLFDTDISHPRAIVVHPTRGLMFWTDWIQRPSNKQSKIERANMDGTGREIWVYNRLQWPNGLSIDPHGGRIYWCDAYTDHIEGVGIFDSSSRVVIANYAHGVQHPYGLVHYNMGSQLVFFWTEFAVGHIMRYNGSNQPAVTVRQDSIPLFDLRVYDRSAVLKKPSGICSGGNGGCSHLCLVSVNGTQSVCNCADGWQLNGIDNRTCIDVRDDESKSDVNIPMACPSTHFKCNNSRCINLRWLCDGDNDCGDNSDEDIDGPCRNFTCPGIGMYTCSNHRCIYERWFCDGEDDCRTGEDELPSNCKNMTCAANTTQCPTNHRCIPNSWICDHDNDCEDGFDEKDCAYQQCRQDQFMCRDQRCISYQYVCDGDYDCRDRSDEESCDYSTTACNNATDFRCNISQKCIPRHMVCNGVNNCGLYDRSDEAGCPSSSPFSCDNGVPLSMDDFACKTSYHCIPRILVCDGDNDCGDNSDEENCTVGEFTCSGSDYHCPDEHRCVPRTWFCDGDTDCRDGSDEANCSSNALVCESPNRMCDNNTVCVKVHSLCDGREDCADKSDEGGICGFNQCDMSPCSHTCHPAPDGFVCLCPHEAQKLGPDGYRCLDNNPCQTWGVCSQECTTVGHSYYCSCMSGYDLQKDAFSCVPNDTVRTFIIFSNRHEIRRLDLQSETYVSLVSGLRNTIALDFYYNHSNNGDNSIIFWTDVIDDKIYKGTLISNSVTNIDTVINYSLATAEGLAVDWITQHIYWVESNLDQIEVADFDGQQRMTLVAGSMESPRAIVVDPEVGLLFWTDWDPNYPRIERCSMSGDNRTVIVNVTALQSAGWPNGIAVDYELKRIYWIDARSDSIHTALYDGSQIQEVLHGHEFLSHPFAITVFGNWIYWSDWRTNSLVKANKWNGTNVQVIERTITQPFDLHIFHPKRQPKTFANPCASNNGGCDKSAVCLLTLEHRPACKCPHMTNMVGNKCQNHAVRVVLPAHVLLAQTTESLVIPYAISSHTSAIIEVGAQDLTYHSHLPKIDKFLLFARKQEVRGVYIDRPYYSVIPAMTVPNVYSPVMLDFTSDLRSPYQIFWTDDGSAGGQFGLHGANLNGTSFELLDSGIQNPYGLAIDWISQNMYTSTYNGRSASISVSKLDGAYRSTLDISSDMLRQPVSIAVHPIKTILFWSDEKLGAIFASHLDGQNARQIYSASGQSAENSSALSLSIDYVNNELWWIWRSGSDYQIMNCTLGDTKLLSSPNTSSQFCNPISFLPLESFNQLTAIAVDENFVYAASSGVSSSTIERIGKTNNQRTVLRNNTSGVTAMKLYDANRPVSVRNVCSVNNGNCTQLCIPHKNGRVCRCTAGFQLNASDQKTCVGVSSFLLYSNSTEILGLPLNATEYSVLPPISRMDSAISIDFNAATGHIYWIDINNQVRSINRVKRDLTQREKIIDFGVLGLEGIAVDWIAGNIYWTDQGLHCIEVARLNGSHRYIVIHNNVDKPRSIAVDPAKGYLYWTDAGSEPKIERARLDGSERTVLVNSSIKAPYGLALDYSDDTLYWCDQQLHKIDALSMPSMQNRTVVANVTDCMGLTVLGDYLYWTDISHEQGSILKVFKENGTGKVVVRSGLGRTVRDIKIFDKERQPDVSGNPCARNNGGCSELCLFNGTAPVCQCSHGRKVNETHCVEYDRFLAFSKVTGIETIHMYESSSDEDVPNPNAPRIAIENAEFMRNVIGLTCDYKSQRYFFSDIQRGDIQSVRFNGSDFRVIIENVGSAEGLAFDQFFQEIYWTSYTNSSISRISVNPQGSRREAEKIVQLGADDHPRAIVIDSCQSKMFWTNWNDHQASIMSSYLSGWEVRKIITQDIKTPNGLAIDHSEHKLYWSDARLDKIEQCNFDGSDRKVVVQGYPQHIFSLAVYGDYLYWTDWLLRAVLRANKYSGSDVTYLKKNILRQPMGIVAVAEDTNSCQKHPCSSENSRCQHQCNTDASGQIFCTCREGFGLNFDNRTCKPLNSTCPASQFSCNSGRCIDIELTCNNHSDCDDGADESPDYCRNRLCPADYFHCTNGRCIESSKKCDKRGNDDCGDGSDEKYCSCNPETEFQCATGVRTCILIQFRCDQDKDCSDASDEIGCPPVNCSHLMQSDLYHNQLIRCNRTTACILPSWICDGHDDCWDNSDEEQNCSSIATPTCDNGWLPCAHGGCVVAGWWCDGDKDCLDGSDEVNCTTRCSAEEHVCDGTRCIPNIWRCDNHKDCYDGTDELNCNNTCLNDQFHCNGSQQCVPRAWVCDGERDCPQGEDEHPGAGCNPVPCGADEFQCLNWQCIRASFFCDGDDDCGDNSDEPSWCEQSMCNNQTEFACAHSRICISLDQRCNGKHDCPDHSDEDNATCSAITQPTCSSDQYKCRDGRCINPETFCSHTGSDTCGEEDVELIAMCDTNECNIAPPKCSHHCVDRPIGYQCSCRRGFQLASDKHNCEDVNECEKHVCSQYCLNTPGSFSCYCASNYSLMADKITCKANSTASPILLVSNRYYLRNITLDGHSVDLIANDLQNAVALDFDWAEQYIYWSDVMSSGSNISRLRLNDSHREVLHSATVRNPDGLAVDWIGRNIYWCDKMTDTIEVSRLDGLYRRVLIRTDLQEPRAIAVHPFRGLLFYTDWGDDAHIGRLGMDGSQRTQVISKDRLGWPNALTIDYIVDEIIWADAKLDYIAISDLNGTKIRYILQGSHLPHIFAISTFEDYIYWTDWEYKSIERANKRTGGDRRNVTHTIHRPMAIQVFHPFRQPLYIKKNQVNPCANHGGCGNGTLCLIKPGGTDRVCACPEKHYQSTDKKTCISNCTSSEFACATTYKCIPFWWRCDGQDDCGDNSDEPKGCRKYVCRSPGMFQCHMPNATGLDCISPVQICDGTPQCNDSSDERNCHSYTCLDSQFKCRNVAGSARCIPSSMRCNGMQDCEDGSDEKNCPITLCTRNQFECSNKRCIPYVWRCDGDDDCGDLSDEPANCTSATCPEGYLKCASTGRCVPTSWRCDGDRDCGESDPSDEPDDCRNTTCEPTYFKCANSRCIPGRWRCDYDDDCRDGSDEANCTRRMCSESEFRCLGDGRCIAAAARCDGIRQCLDGSDEAMCNITSTCAPDEFRCHSTPYCIPMDWKCDREADCIDESDEANCHQFENKCGMHERSCMNGACIPSSWWCDGVADCSDKSDEASDVCNAGHACSPGFARCADNRCVLRDFVCDGVQHCRDGSDESNCGNNTCRKNEWQCSISRECIEQDKLCDTISDCLDGTDEGAVCQTSINCTTDVDCPSPYVCRHLPPRLNVLTFMELLVRQLSRPKPTPIYAGYCRCMDGFKMDSEGRCNAINRCNIFGYCPQRCNPHYQKCACDENYITVQLNRTTCIAKGHSPYLVLLSESSLFTVAPNDPLSLLRRVPKEKGGHAADHSLRMNSVDFVVSGNVTKLFVASHSDGAIYQVDLPVKLAYLSSSSTSSSVKDKTRVRRGADAVEGMKRIELPQLSSLSDIAIDWVSNKIYWIEGSPANLIGMSNLDGSKKTTIISRNLHQPTAIVVDPESSRMFWSNVGSLHARIESANLDGSDRQIIVQSKVVWPSDLSLDFAGRRLYWVDMKKRMIESVKLDGSDRRVIWAFALNESFAGVPYRLDVFEDRLYVLMRDHSSIFILNKFRNTDNPGHLLINNASQTAPINYLLLVQQYRKKNTINNPCSSSPCNISGSVCINTPNGMPSCLCPDNSILNGTVCQPVPVSPNVCANYCQHRGQCTVTEQGQPKCTCSSMYSGRRCENDLCHGACIVDNTKSCTVADRSDSSSVKCICKKEYEGLRCDHRKCDGYCKSGGSCRLDPAMSTPKCTCPPAYKGPTCEERRKNACDGVTCFNGGTCRSIDDRQFLYKCDCADEYHIGDHCETCHLMCPGPSCSNHTCEVCSGSSSNNGGRLSCQSNPESYCVVNVRSRAHSCHCPLGYRQLDNCTQCPQCVDSCESFCNNGGTCVHDAITGQPQCTCSVPYFGERCDLNCSSCSVNGTRQCSHDSCHCYSGWSGTNCDIVGNDCQLTGSVNSCELMPDVCHNQCQNGGTCLNCSVYATSAKCLTCRCAGGLSDSHCNDNSINVSVGGINHVGSVFIALFVILIVAAIIVGAIIVYHRHHNGQFKHKRMSSDNDGANVEISNPIYMKDYEDDDVAEEFALEADKPMNFSNPLYDSLYSEPSGSDILPSETPADDAESSRLLAKTKEKKSRTKSSNKNNDNHSSSSR